MSTGQLVRVTLVVAFGFLPNNSTGGSKRGVSDTFQAPGGQILSISSSFGENLAKLYVGAPIGLAPPPWGNPGSTTA